MTAKTIAIVSGMVAVAVCALRGNAEPATLPSNAPGQDATPDDVFERKIPPEILKLRGKCVRFAYDVFGRRRVGGC